MGMTALAAVAAPVVSSAVGGMLGGGGSSGGYSGGSYLPPNLGQAAGNELGLIPQLGQNNLYQQYLPQAQSAVNQALYSPYYGQALQGAQQAAGAGMQQGYNALGGANQLYGQMGQIPGLENQLVQSAFDPQSQLYNYLQAQNTNQTNADLAARGLGMSGAGAQIASQQNQLFNQNWQNNLLNRQLQGVQGVGALNQSAGQLGTIGANLGTQGTNLINQSASMPYQTQLNALQNQLGLIGTAGQYGQQANVPYQQQIADYNSYQGLGSPSAQFGQQQAAMQGAASIAQPIGNAIGGAVGNWAAGLGGGNSGNYFGTGSGYNPNFMTLPGG
ncbi:MAG: hypothetical protein B7Z66_15600 [Chromatiales bacterium 21-64-14]|nr:MAG: hypothetical protein B7Z66_15600 [Chromatiales bacterium 21-64-14]